MQTINQKTFTVRNYWHRFRRRKWIGVISLLLSIAIAILVALTATPVYRAKTTLIAEELEQYRNPLDGLSMVPIPAEERPIMIQARLRSHTLLMEVAKKLNLRDYLDMMLTS